MAMHRQENGGVEMAASSWAAVMQHSKWPPHCVSTGAAMGVVGFEAESQVSDPESCGSMVGAQEYYLQRQVRGNVGVEGSSGKATDPQTPPRFATDPDRLSPFSENGAAHYGSSARRALNPFLCDCAEAAGSPFVSELFGSDLFVSELPSSTQFDSQGLSTIVSGPESLSTFVGDPQVSGSRFECDPTQFVNDGPSSSEMVSSVSKSRGEVKALEEVEERREEEEEEEEEEAGVELIDLLLACTEAVGSRSLSLVNPLLAQLGKRASPEGSALERVVAYFTEGLAYRVAETWPQLYQPLPCNLEPSEEEAMAAYHILNHVCPYTKFSHFTANEAILQAFEGEQRVHVIDLDIQQGLQWPALFHSLASRPGVPPHLRITGVGECKEELQETGDRLAEFAADLNLPFQFHAVMDSLEELRLWMLHVKEKEAVAVNSVSQLHRALHDDSGRAVQDVLSVIKSTKPKVVVMVEQEANHNGPFAARVLEALHYYSAIFDSIHTSLPPDSHSRMKLEKLFAREIRNIVACEGLDRVERHEKLQRWRHIFHTAGFHSLPLGHRAASQAQLLLYMFSNKGYTLVEDKGALILSWLDRPLFSVSSWTLTSSPSLSS